MIKEPICKKCKEEVVLADAGALTSIPYWYCRTCKVEVDTLGNEINTVQEKPSELDTYFAEEVTKLDECFAGEVTKLDEYYAGEVDFSDFDIFDDEELI